MTFGWDDDTAATNLRKHGASFAEALTALLDDRLAATAYDPDHSAGEDRYVTLGTSVTGCLLLVSHCDRSGRLRVVSARAATRRERRRHEHGTDA